MPDVGASAHRSTDELYFSDCLPELPAADKVSPCPGRADRVVPCTVRRTTIVSSYAPAGSCAEVLGSRHLAFQRGEARFCLGIPNIRATPSCTGGDFEYNSPAET